MNADDGYTSDGSMSSNDSFLGDWMAMPPEMVREMEVELVVQDLVDAVIDMIEIPIVQAVQNAIAMRQVVVVPVS